jgi:hypothetical protein
MPGNPRWVRRNAPHVIRDHLMPPGLSLGNHSAKYRVDEPGGFVRPHRPSKAHALINRRVVRNPQMDDLVHTEAQNIECPLVDGVNGATGGMGNHDVQLTLAAKSAIHQFGSKSPITFIQPRCPEGFRQREIRIGTLCVNFGHNIES